MKPTLPQGGLDGALRAAALEAARGSYRYSYTYPPGAAWADAVPKGDGYSLFYVLCARFIHRVSTYHAGINYGWYDWMAYVPNMPAATMAPMPPVGAPVADDAWLGLMPARGLGWEHWPRSTR